MGAEVLEADARFGRAGVVKRIGYGELVDGEVVKHRVLLTEIIVHT